MEVSIVYSPVLHLFVHIFNQIIIRCAQLNGCSHCSSLPVKLVPYLSCSSVVVVWLELDPKVRIVQGYLIRERFGYLTIGKRGGRRQEGERREREGERRERERERERKSILHE